MRIGITDLGEYTSDVKVALTIHRRGGNRSVSPGQVVKADPIGVTEGRVSSEAPAKQQRCETCDYGGFHIKLLTSKRSKCRAKVQCLTQSAAAPGQKR